MIAQIDGQTYDCTYKYVAYMKTAKGDTYYGELRTFKTGEGDATGIEAKTVLRKRAYVGVYSLNGHRQDQLRRGLNIIRMSDGTVKKVMVR